ncbi:MULTISPECIES: AAA family ATPase [Methylobacterium]|jgi:chromosome partitioning protein|uniref:Chromosome partitioning protein n=2 Tax=Methylobacterium TaxID=407 RepID=A0A0C6FVA0_9HYPH|nr:MULTISPECIES: AAA family ATPase [Methylobacterium]MBZ6412248.1 AAA family ATPase [Methylobacterium sp.]MBK3400676.1 AAA family ATPase [Methylobacterium ajmalii]MBK3421216.1 AAA family ATPase [Methylobacterium ajmalii]SFE73873.1 Cellulose biosynthesis protein BcsQ [Methylobacterium sp. yr596]BAQ47080.1 chromosome partitioning protein [Methylobacterium aquaticum]
MTGKLPTGKLVAVANMKGGVGKTTSVVMLADALAAGGASVLVIDLDPQASASVCFAGDAILAEMITGGRTLDYYLGLRIVDRDKAALPDFIRDHVSSTTHLGEPLPISLLASGPSLRIVEREIIYALTKRKFSMHAIEGHLWKLFQEDFAPLRDQYDYVLFDCAPGISPMTEVAIRASDLVVVACISDFLSTYGLKAFYETIWGVGSASESMLAPRRPPHVLITRWQNTKQQATTFATLQASAAAQDARFRLFRTRVPQSAALANALTLEYQTFANKYRDATRDLIGEVITPVVAELKEALDGA